MQGTQPENVARILVVRECAHLELLILLVPALDGREHLVLQLAVHRLRCRVLIGLGQRTPKGSMWNGSICASGAGSCGAFMGVNTSSYSLLSIACSGSA